MSKPEAEQWKAEYERLAEAVRFAIDYAGGRESEWGERAEECFRMLETAVSRKPEQPQPAEDPDEWVIQDRVPIRTIADRAWLVSSRDPLPKSIDEYWQKYAHDVWLDGHRHGDEFAGGTLHVMCRRRDLPKGEQVEQWPKYYTTLDSPSSDVAFVKRVDETSYSVVYKNGRECPGFLWVAQNQSRRKQLTEDEAMALLNPTSNAYFSYHEKQKPQPQKTRVRLWMRNEPKGRPSLFACDERPYPDSHKYVEIHHDSEGFYTID